MLLAVWLADILNPSDKLALRLSSHLMLGVVKIYQRKAQYLLVEAGDAVYKIKTVTFIFLYDTVTENG